MSQNSRIWLALAPSVVRVFRKQRSASPADAWLPSAMCLGVACMIALIAVLAWPASPASADHREQVTVLGTPSFRSEPYLSSEAKGLLEHGQHVDVLCHTKGDSAKGYGNNPVSDDWHQVRANGEIGFVHDGYLWTDHQGKMQGESQCKVLSIPSDPNPVQGPREQSGPGTRSDQDGWSRTVATTAGGVNIRVSANFLEEPITAHSGDIEVFCWTEGASHLDYLDRSTKIWHRVKIGDIVGFASDGYLLTGVNGPMEGEPPCYGYTATTEPQTGTFDGQRPTRVGTPDLASYCDWEYPQDGQSVLERRLVTEGWPGAYNLRCAVKWSGDWENGNLAAAAAGKAGSLVTFVVTKPLYIMAATAGVEATAYLDQSVDWFLGDNWTRHHIDVREACRWQFSSTAEAYTVGSGPSDWRCRWA